MNTFQYRVSQRIDKNTLEYQSILDTKKIDNLYTLTKTNSHNLQNFIFNPKPRIFNIPIVELKVHHQKYAVLNPDGAILVNGKYFQNTPNKPGIENFFNYIENLNLTTIKTIVDLKAFFKKIYFSYFSLKAYRNKRILQDANIVKIIFFETAYDNMYHFIFQYYPSLLKLIQYCKKHQLDYYIIMPPKCNRGLRFRYFYNGFIQDLIKIEKIDMHKILFLDYQNYNVCNLYHTNFPSENPNLQNEAIHKIKSHFFSFLCKNKTKMQKVGRGGGTESILVEKKR